MTCGQVCYGPGTPAAFVGSVDPGPSDELHIPPAAELQPSASPEAAQSPAGTGEPSEPVRLEQTQSEP